MSDQEAERSPKVLIHSSSSAPPEISKPQNEEFEIIQEDHKSPPPDITHTAEVPAQIQQIEVVKEYPKINPETHEEPQTEQQKEVAETIDQEKLTSPEVSSEQPENGRLPPVEIPGTLPPVEIPGEQKAPKREGPLPSPPLPQDNPAKNEGEVFTVSDSSKWEVMVVYPNDEDENRIKCLSCERIIRAKSLKSHLNTKIHKQKMKV